MVGGVAFALVVLSAAVIVRIWTSTRPPSPHVSDVMALDLRASDAALPEALRSAISTSRPTTVTLVLGYHLAEDHPGGVPAIPARAVDDGAPPASGPAGSRRPRAGCGNDGSIERVRPSGGHDRTVAPVARGAPEPLSCTRAPPLAVRRFTALFTPGALRKAGASSSKRPLLVGLRLDGRGGPVDFGDDLAEVRQPGCSFGFLEPGVAELPTTEPRDAHTRLLRRSAGSSQPGRCHDTRRLR